MAKDTSLLVNQLDLIRKKIFLFLIIIILIAIISFAFASFFLQILLRPAGDLTLVYLAPPDAFLANIRIAITIGFMVTIPLLIHQIVIFIFPLFFKKQRKTALIFIFSAILLFIIGLVFAYFVAFPFVIRFFLNFATTDLLPTFTITDYISFATNFFLAFALAFETPLIFWILGKLNIVSPKMLKQNRKFALLVIIVLSAFITPPDLISQIMISLPLILLYEISILTVRNTQK